MTTQNYHPTPPQVAPRSEKTTKEKGTSEKSAKQKMKEHGNGIGRHQENPPYVDDLLWPFNPPPVGTSVKLKTDGQVLDVVIEIMRPDHPKDIRDVQLLYIEKVASVAMLERDGKVEKCHEAALVGSH
ncbi:hypothetical protein ZWY2020_054890 [Hordeum vulgare]|nr:hypothetical protein ZWY2020_054890 [Hordeum vulgare]